MFQSLLATIDDQFVHLVYRYQITDQPIHTHVNLESYATNVPEGEQSDGVKKKSINSKQQKVKNTQQLGTGGEIQGEKKKDSIINKDKLGRNDPCWCGSGKKYKKCHYPN
jgi:preprotein translocase subunit SecA